jgi:hypothetical protein
VVMLDSARRKVPVPARAGWALGLGIAAALAIGVGSESSATACGTRRACVIRVRAQRREVRPNMLASLRSERGLPA